MDEEKSYSIINSLANGVHPVTGEIFEINSPYNHPDIIRALFFILNNKKQGKTYNIKKTLEQKQEENIQKGLPKNSGLPWSNELKSKLANQFKETKSISELAIIFERTTGSIIAELVKQGLVSPEERYRY
ncbi:MAG: hypothetical protein KU38_03165 [Sulfurovum sp. FS08-3]|nr:MAG: hypothetical protein KU38_03165 [Sulfurovum sp. FS08-3]